MRALDSEGQAAAFRAWYPGFRPRPEKAAAVVFQIIDPSVSREHHQPVETNPRCHHDQPPRRAGNSGLDAQSNLERMDELSPARRE
jgi:hypothetical protein